MQFTIVITGSALFSNPSSSIPFQDMVAFHWILDPFKFNLSNSLLESFGLKSSSTVYNSSSFFVSLVLFLLMHVGLMLLSKLFGLCGTEGRWWWLFNKIRWVVAKVINLMTFGYYIRYVLQMNQFLLISSMYELYTLNLSHTLNIVSFLFALLMFAAWVSLPIFLMCLALSSYKLSEGKQNKIGELFTGLKMDKTFKLYSALLVIRRTVFAILLIWMMSCSPTLVIGILGRCYF